MGHQSAHYLKLKGKTYYFSRRVPKVLQQYSSVPRVEICLHTNSRALAQRQALLLSQELEDQWSILRRRQRQDRVVRLLGNPLDNLKVQTPVSSDAPLLSEGLETYLKLKGDGRPATFEAGARRSIGYLLEVTDDKPLDTYDRKDANALREYLKERGLARESITRNFTNVRAIVNFALREHGQQPSTAFSGLFLGEAVAPKKRYVPTSDELLRLQALCKSYDDEPRWILGLISDTGLRLSEAIGAIKEDIRLNHQIPHLIVRPHSWRRLKTQSSEREVPLVGVSLWAAQRAYSSTDSPFLFPRYANAKCVMSNSASASLNKWLKHNINRELVIHSLRHLMRDRLRSVECPREIIDTIGGWKRDGVGEAYGKGFSLDITNSWMMLIRTS
jgi:integrase